MKKMKSENWKVSFDILTKIGRRGKIGHSKSSPGPKIDPQTPKIDPQGPKIGSEGPQIRPKSSFKPSKTLLKVEKIPPKHILL